MKLIDLLVQELPKRGGWPEVALNATQDKDGEVCFSSGAIPEFGYAAWEGGDWCGNEFHTIRANDYDTAIITRAQYEAALEASEGWIQWAGGECPVDSDAIVEVKYRIPKPYQYNNYNDRAGDFDWEHIGSNADIIAYRLQDQGINSSTKNDQLEQDLNECIGHDLDPALSGNGMPPVGAKVEFFINPKFGYRNDLIPDAGTEMEVVAHKTTTDGNDVAVCYWDEDGAGRSCCFVPESLNPLGTEAERKRNIAAQALCNSCGGTGKVDENLGFGVMWFDIYDAIASGKIPGVKLEGK